ncbi:MAG: sugar ABC transporter permease [Actinobacteria bacterium]|nr:sugar ABC transporter permease [Actinomycetota bacterium]
MTAIAPPVATAQPARARPDRRRAGWARRAPLLPALVFTIIVTQLPFLLTLWYSLESWSLVRPGSQHFVWFANYAQVFSDSQFWTTALNTVVMTVGTVLIAMVIGIGLALLLDRKFIGRGVVRTLLITPFLVMPVASALVWKTVMLDPTFGIVNFLLRPFGIGHFDWLSKFPLGSVMIDLIWQWTPFMMLLVLAGLQSQPKDILEAASTDGARPLAIFRELTLPHLRRYIELGIVLGAIYIVNEFDAVYMMTQGGPGISSANLPFYIYQRAFLGFQVGQAAAMGVVVVIMTIIVATFALRLIFKTFSGTEQAA